MGAFSGAGVITKGGSAIGGVSLSSAFTVGTTYIYNPESIGQALTAVGSASMLHRRYFAKAGTLSAFRANISAAVGATNTGTATVRLGGSNTAIAVAWSNADGTVEKTDADSVSVAAGEYIDIIWAVTGAGSNPTLILNWTMQYTEA